MSGFAAATEARRKGRSVLLVDERGDLLWEITRAFMPQLGDSDAPEWNQWKTTMQEAKALSENALTGGATEVLATRHILQQQIETLYYVNPVAVTMEESDLMAVTVATPSGLRLLKADQWIDATETGLLIRLMNPQATMRNPVNYQLTLGLQSQAWRQIKTEDLTSPGTQHGRQTLMWHSGANEWERLLVARFNDAPENLALWMFEALEAMANMLGESFMKDMHLSHSSMVPFPLYHGTKEATSAPSNLALAAPALSPEPVNTLAERYQLGLWAARQVRTACFTSESSVLPDPEAAHLRLASETEADLVVAGLGTGGAIAAIAARRTADVRVIGLDPLWLPGGIGTVGGIHKYHRGVMGGLQHEVDQRVMSLMTRWPRVFQMGAFSPWAKQIVLTQMLNDAGVERRHEQRVIAAETDTDSGWVKSIRIAGPNGVVKIKAAAWVDGTADAILTSHAGGKTWFGRAGDRQTQCYSQSATLLLGTDSTGPRSTTTNIDSGWCDSSDAEDLTRARMIGIDQYHEEVQSGKGRWIYIAPALGLRQGPMVECDTTLTLDDAVFPRLFHDAIAYYCCQQDTHNPDAYFEDDDTFFWCWVINQRGAQIAGTIPYRSLLPKSLANVWIGSRSLGVSQAVQYAARQQRDIQRIGEAAGVAAALAVSGQTPIGSREIDYDSLKQRLKASGAIPAGNDPALRRMGNPPDMELFASPPKRPTMAEALAELDSGIQSRKLWVLKERNSEMLPELEQRMKNQQLPWATRWVAAKIAGFHGSEKAELMMLEIVRSAPEHLYDFPKALALLGRCGTCAALPALGELSRTPEHLTLDIRVLILRALESILQRNTLSSQNKETVLAMVTRLSQRPVPGSRHANKYDLCGNANAFLKDADATFELKQKDITRSMPMAVDDHLWRLDLWLARIRQALGVDPQETFRTYHQDPRPIVRRAFASIAPDDRSSIVTSR